MFIVVPKLSPSLLNLKYLVVDFLLVILVFTNLFSRVDHFLLFWYLDFANSDISSSILVL